MPRAVVAGAGVMGVWIAHHLRRRGFEVTLADPWDPGHPRATSASESRIIRCLYGKDALYAEWSRRSLHAWDEWQRETGRVVLFKTGVLWLAHQDPGYESAGEATLRRLGLPIERLTPDELRARFPQVAAEGFRFAVFEPEAGALLARKAVRVMAELFARGGGRIARGAAAPGEARGGRLRDVTAGGARIAADAFVFACGPWLPKVFPDLLEGAIRVCSAPELYFGVPPEDARFEAPAFPCWAALGSYYGIPALYGRGFKVGVDRPGPAIDPDTDDRQLDEATLADARAFLARCFPALARAPLVGARVCTYELTPDEHLILDRHPGFDNVWIAGGGSGHAFKLGPALGDYVASLVTGETKQTEPRFRLGPRPARPWREA